MSASNIRSIFAAFALAAVATPALAQNPVRVVCSASTGANQGFFVSIVSFPGETPLATLTTYKGGAQTTVTTFQGAQIRELYQGYYRTNVTASKASSGLKISADVNIFGGNVSNPEEARWNGKLWLSNDLRAAAAGKNVSDVSCTHDI